MKSRILERWRRDLRISLSVPVNKRPPGRKRPPGDAPVAAVPRPKPLPLEGGAEAPLD